MNEPTRKSRAVRPLRVLVADDDRDTVSTLSSLLHDEGHEVVEVYRGDAVLQLVRKYRPHAALLDIGMPGLTGFEIARQLREELRQQCPLLVAVTAWDQEAAKELGRLAGFHHYLTKPYSTEDLLAVLAPLAAGPARRE